jgi:rhamnosyltransferase
VIVRARNEAASIGRCLDIVRGQRVDPDRGEIELIVVDNASSDGTGAIAAERGARVLSLPRERFSFGRALNLGAAQAAGEVLVALSAHAFPYDLGWLERLARVFDDPAVACASGERHHPDGRRLAGLVVYDAALAGAYPEWGFSNAAGAFRASLWRARPFREDLPACEDKEWCRHWVTAGFTCVLDPALSVRHDHTHDPVLDIYRRAEREARGLAMFLPDRPAPTVPTLLSEWWSDTRFYENPWRARLSHRRAARLLGAYGGGSRPKGTRATRRLDWIRRLWRRASGSRESASR